MSGLDSISDPVARRISSTVSYPSGHGSAPTRLGSTQLGLWLMTCQSTGLWHGMPIMHDDVTITSGWRHPYHAYCACWHHSYVMLTSSLSGSVKWRAFMRVPSHLAGAWGCFWRLISASFSPVASSLPPLHSGMVKT
jgi:hypothetical protein